MNDPITWLNLLLSIVPLMTKAYRWIQNRVKWRGISEDARKTAFAIHGFSWVNLQQNKPVIERVGLIDRPELGQIQTIWDSSDTPLVLHGEAGTGKSGIALRLGCALSNAGMPVLFLKATDFPSDQDPVTIIQNRMALSMPVMEAFARLSKERSFSVIVDQLDTVAGTDLGKNFSSFIKTLAGIQGIKVLAVTRSFELANDPDISKLEFLKIESGSLSNEQALDYLTRIGLAAPSQVILTLGSNLLNLSLISDVVVLTPDQAPVFIDEVALWKQYFVSIQQREGDESAEFVLRLARQTAAKGERHFSVEFPDARTRRKLLSRGILANSPGRRYTFRHEQLQDFLCAYALLPEHPTLIQLLSEFEGNLPKGVISWLHRLYHAERSDLEPAFIDDVLGARDELRFYTRILVLENLKQQKDPTELAARIIAKHTTDRAYHRYFFEDLNNPAWIEPSYKARQFHNPMNPIEVEPGSYQLPPWPAGEYLVRFADQHEEIIVAIVQSIKTENWRVHELLADALIKISPAVAAGLTPQIDAWLFGRFSGSMPEGLIPLAEHLCQAGFVNAAIQILESVITPVLPENETQAAKYFSPIRFRSEHYWVNQYCESQLPVSLSLNPVGVVLAFERQLIRAIELVKQDKGEDTEKWIGLYWRMDIPNRISERQDADALDILVDGLRDSLAEVCKQSTREGNKFLDHYLASEHIIFQRLALYTLRLYGQKYPEALNQALLERGYLEQGEYANEYRGLLRDQFANAAEEVRERVITWILAGPLDVETRANRLAQVKKREMTDEDRREVQEDWSLFHLEIIRNFLGSEAIDRLNQLTQRHGKPDISERSHMVTSTLGGPPSPVPADELARKSFEEIKVLFLTFVPTDAFLDSRESLAQTFQKLVQEDSAKYSEFAEYLIDPQIRFVYTYHYLFGFRESLKNQDVKLEEPIFKLCEYLVSLMNDPFIDSSGRYEPVLSETHLQIAHLLEQVLSSDDPYFSSAQLDRLKAILINLVHHPDPTPEKDKNSSFDPISHSLSCVRGMAMRAIIKYSLYLVRRQEKLKSELLPQGFLELEIRAVLEEKLNIDKDPSLAVRSVFGAFLLQLYYLDREWLQKHLAAIFPEQDDKTIYWKAAWDAYLFGSRAYRDIFVLLDAQYQRGVRLLSLPQDEKKAFKGFTNEHLAIHIIFAYLTGLTDFGHANELLDLFFANAPDMTRANGIFWISGILGNEKPALESDLWKKCWALWQKRLAQAETQEIAHNTQEISAYMRWLENCPVGLDSLYPTLHQTVKYLHDDYDARLLVSFAALQCQHFPLEAVTLLQMTILGVKESWWAFKKGNEETILRAAMASDHNDARRIAEEIINYRGEQGDYRWKDLLDYSGG